MWPQYVSCRVRLARNVTTVWTCQCHLSNWAVNDVQSWSVISHQAVWAWPDVLWTAGSHDATAVRFWSTSLLQLIQVGLVFPKKGHLGIVRLDALPITQPTVLKYQIELKTCLQLEEITHRPHPFFLSDCWGKVPHLSDASTQRQIQ